MVTSVSTAPTARHGRRRAFPAVRRVDLNGEAVICVELGGKGHLHEMLVSAPRWPEIVRRWGPHWLVLRRGRRHRWRVISTDQDVAREAGVSMPMLARLLTNAGPDQLVKYGNRNPLDLRDGNLSLVSARTRKGA